MDCTGWSQKHDWSKWAIVPKPTELYGPIKDADTLPVALIWVQQRRCARCGYVEISTMRIP